MRLGLVGYGYGGRLVHAPFIEAAPGVELAGVVTRSVERRQRLHADQPEVPAFESLAELLAAGVDAVTISTPLTTRRELVLEAVAAGVHVISDSPFAASAAEARELAAAAEAAGVLLSPYFQRRRDADILTAKQVIEGGKLGTIRRFHSRFDIDEPSRSGHGPQGGVLRDLGSHLVDQALWLFGPAARVYAQLDWAELPEGLTDCGFVVSLEHAGGMMSYLTASELSHVSSRTLRIYGSGGFYRSSSSDVQLVDVLAGRRPLDNPDAWGYEPPQHWGQLETAGGTQTIASAQGRYHDYYAQFAAAVAGTGRTPVTAADAIAVLEVLDAVRTSAAERVLVSL